MSSWWKKQLLVLSLISGASPLWGQTEDAGIPKDAINPFARNYVFYEISSSRTVDKTKHRFESVNPSHGLGFRHNIDASWFMGLTVHKRELRRISDDLKLPFLAFGHESLYTVRLYHPFYLLTGPRLFLFMPLEEKITIPLDKSPYYEPEVGVGWLASVVYRMSESVLFSAQLERWRGTKTDRFHGVEMGLALQLKLP